MGRTKRACLLHAPDTLRLGCSYHLHSSHRFLSTWGAVTMLEKNKKQQQQQQQLLKKHGTYSATFTVVILHKAETSITSACFSLNSYLSFIGSMSTCPLTTPTKSHPHKLNYCHCFFAMPSALICKVRISKVYAKHYGIMVAQNLSPK